MLDSVTFNYFFPNITIIVNISETVTASAKVRDVAFIDFDIYHRMAPLAFFLPWPWPTCSRSNASNVNISETVRDIAKIFDRAFIDFDTRTNSAIGKVYSATVTYFSRSNISDTYISNRGKLVKNTSYDFCRLKHLPSNGATAKFLLDNLDLLFQGQLFQMLIFRKRWEMAQKYQIRLWDIFIFFHRVERYRKSYSATSTYIIKFKITISH